MKIVKAKVVPYKPLTDADVDKAIARGRKLKRLYANASNVRYEHECISIGFSDGSRVMLPVAGLPEFEGFSWRTFSNWRSALAARRCAVRRRIWTFRSPGSSPPASP